MHIISAGITEKINILTAGVFAGLVVYVCMPDVCPLDLICALEMITVHSHFT